MITLVARQSRNMPTAISKKPSAAEYLASRIRSQSHPKKNFPALPRMPKVPLLICYWKPEDDLESELNIFFDSKAEDNLPIESIYTLGAGLVVMFEKLALRHG